MTAKIEGRTTKSSPKGAQVAKRMNVIVRGANVKKRHGQTVGKILGIDRPTVRAVRRGFSPLVIGRLSKSLDLSTEKTLTYVNLTRQTYARRKRAGKLTTQESDRVWRVASLLTRANELLGDEDLAAEWLRTPSISLDGETPLERAKTEIGSWDVEQLIGRLEHGIPT